MTQKLAGLLAAFYLLTAAVAAAQTAPQGTMAKPRVAILTTGGTIAGQADPRSVLGYNAGKLGAQQLIAAAPGIESLAELSSEKVASIGSQNMTDEVLLALARRISEIFSRDEADGVVVTHGTDSMEETALFLDLVLPHDRPVVLVGSMRPSTALSADGPSNLYSAVQVATSPSARGRGVLVVLNNEIHGPRGVQKISTSTLNAFGSPSSGPVGHVDPANVRFVASVAPSSGRPYALPPSAQLPRVDIVYGYAQGDDFAVTAAVEKGARGIVLAGMGDGNAPAAVIEALRKAAARGIVVVRSTRVGSGFVERNVENDDDALGFVASLDLNPQKARVLTRLLIANGITTPAQVQKAFAAGVR